MLLIITGTESWICSASIQRKTNFTSSTTPLRPPSQATPTSALKHHTFLKKHIICFQAFPAKPIDQSLTTCFLTSMTSNLTSEQSPSVSEQETSTPTASLISSAATRQRSKVRSLSSLSTQVAKWSQTRKSRS